MQKFILILTFLALSANTLLHAQQKRIGFRASYFSGSYAWPKTSEYAQGTFDDFSGLDAGLSYRVSLGNSPLGLQLEATFYGRPIKGEQSTAYNTYIELEGRQNVLCIPIMLSYGVGKGLVRGHVAAGFSMGVIFPKALDKASYLANPTSFTSKGLEGGFPVEAGISVGLGGKLRLEAGLRYYWAQFNSEYTKGPTSASTHYRSNWFVRRMMPGLAIFYEL